MSKNVLQIIFSMLANGGPFTDDFRNCVYRSARNELKMQFWIRFHLLTPKGPRCLLGQYKFFGQVPVTRDFHVFGPNFD